MTFWIILGIFMFIVIVEIGKALTLPSRINERVELMMSIEERLDAERKAEKAEKKRKKHEPSETYDEDFEVDPW